jgi:large subunit ribosomal protein L18
MNLKRKEIRVRIHERIRKRVEGSPERPRMSVYRSGQHIYAQIIDDTKGHTIASASSLKADGVKGGTVDGAVAVGKRIAEAAKAAGVEKVVFDRGGYIYHGRVKALADAAREAGLDF